MSGTPASVPATDPSGTEVPNQNVQPGQQTGAAPTEPSVDPTIPAPDGANPAPEGPTAAQIQAKLDAALAELDKEKGKRVKTVEESQNRKKKLQDLQMEAGQYEPVIAGLREEVAAKDSELATIMAERDALLTEVEGVRKANSERRTALLLKIPEADRSLFDKDSITVEDLERAIDRFYKNSTGKAKTPEAETPSGQAGGTPLPRTLGEALQEEYRKDGLDVTT
jgi:hypothetical protein